MSVSHLVQFSGGISSWRCARRVAESIYQPGDRLILVFAGTLIEDEDLYRFLGEAVADIQKIVPTTEFVRLADGRDPWQVFRDVRFLGNTRVDPCSRILKREIISTWRDSQFTPETCVTYLGFSWDESDRWEKARPLWAPWPVRAPLCEKPFLPMGRVAAMQACRDAGIEPPRLYAMGFSHNNCGGFCVKAGHAHFKLLLEKLPDRYAEHERKEQEFRDFLGRQDIAILKDRREGTVKPLTLRELRERTLTTQESFDFGGCSCFLPDTSEGSEDGRSAWVGQ